MGWDELYRPEICTLYSHLRGVASGQVVRYLPDHFFSKLPERLPIQNGRSLLYYDRDLYLDLTFTFRMNQKHSQV